MRPALPLEGSFTAQVGVAPRLETQKTNRRKNSPENWYWPTSPFDDMMFEQQITYRELAVLR
jgi:hypothetical protein